MSKREIALTEQRIAKKIHTIRGQKVMLDRDLAELYSVKTYRLNEQVKRNIKRFPSDFMFQLNIREAEASRSQNAILKRGENIKYLPYAFTENGVAMLSSVLNSEQAIQVNIQIIRAFNHLRRFRRIAAELQQQLRLLEHQSAGHKARLDVALDAISIILDQMKNK